MEGLTVKKHKEIKGLKSQIKKERSELFTEASYYRHCKSDKQKACRKMQKPAKKVELLQKMPERSWKAKREKV